MADRPLEVLQALPAPLLRKPGWPAKDYFLNFSLLAAICLFGCGKKKETPQTAPPASQTAPAAPAQPAGSPSAPPAAVSSPPPAPAGDSYEANVTARSIDYLQGQIARKNWAQARLALKQVEARSLSPEQRKYVDGLKAQIPQ